MNILKQLKTTNCKAFKKRGIWTKHYTMTLWESEQQLKDFARSGAHLEAMKTSKSIASEIKTYTYDADKLPDWNSALKLLDTIKPITYS